MTSIILGTLAGVIAGAAIGYLLGKIPARTPRRQREVKITAHRGRDERIVAMMGARTWADAISGLRAAAQAGAIVHGDTIVVTEDGVPVSSTIYDPRNF